MREIQKIRCRLRPKASSFHGCSSFTSFYSGRKRFYTIRQAANVLRQTVYILAEFHQRRLQPLHSICKPCKSFCSSRCERLRLASYMCVPCLKQSTGSQNGLGHLILRLHAAHNPTSRWRTDCLRSQRLVRRGRSPDEIQRVNPAKQSAAGSSLNSKSQRT